MNVGGLKVYGCRARGFGCRIDHRPLPSTIWRVLITESGYSAHVTPENIPAPVTKNLYLSILFHVTSLGTPTAAMADGAPGATRATRRDKSSKSTCACIAVRLRRLRVLHRWRGHVRCVTLGWRGSWSVGATPFPSWRRCKSESTCASLQLNLTIQ